MNRFLLLLLTAICLADLSFAQQYTSTPSTSSNHRIGITGGLSMPLGAYAGDVGRAETGFFAGAFYNYSFASSPWGIRADARFIRHQVQPLNSDPASSPYVYTFPDGFSKLQQTSNPYFQHIGVFLGPSYQIQFQKFRWNTFLEAGGLFQEYHEFQQQVYALNPFTSSYEQVLIPYTSDNPTKSPTAISVIAGTEIAYEISPSFLLGLQIEYLRAFGANGTFYTVEHTSTQEIKSIEFIRDPQTGDVHNNVFKYFQKEGIRKAAPIQSVNIGLSLSYTFGKKAPKEKASGNNHNAIIEVKDKITGQSIPNAAVELVSADGDKIIGITGVDGKFYTYIQPVAHVITGKYDNINTSNEHIKSAEIGHKPVHKILYYDDDRFILSGKTIDCKTGKPLGNIETQLIDLATNQTLYTKSDKDGNFTYRLNQQANYHLTANQDGKFSQTESISTKGVQRSKTIFITLELGVCDIEEGAIFNIKNIFYDFDKATIRPDAALLLNNVVNIMQKNPTIEIELSAHTDVRGDDQYNLSLSQRRAESAVNYIVNKGISRNRITAKGYGESQLKNHCKEGVQCTDAEHEVNRRTEIKITKY